MSHLVYINLPLSQTECQASPSSIWVPVRPNVTLFHSSSQLLMPVANISQHHHQLVAFRVEELHCQFITPPTAISSNSIQQNDEDVVMEDLSNDFNNLSLDSIMSGQHSYAHLVTTMVEMLLRMGYANIFLAVHAVDNVCLVICGTFCQGRPL